MAVIGQDDSVQLEIAVRSASHHLDEWQATCKMHGGIWPGTLPKDADERLSLCISNTPVKNPAHPNSKTSIFCSRPHQANPINHGPWTQMPPDLNQ
jgi:hypothetical protein